MASKTTAVARFFFLDLAGSIVHFPMWWYTSGAFGVITWMRDDLGYRWKSYSIGIWIKNFFVPMYGQYDWTGKIVSVFMRIVVLVGRLIFFAIESALYSFLLVLWLVAPPVLLFLFIQSFSRGAFVAQVRDLIP